MQSYRGLRRRSLDGCYHLGNVFDAIVSSLWKPSTRDPPITSSYKKSAWSVCILICKDAWNHASAGNCTFEKGHSSKWPEVRMQIRCATMERVAAATTIKLEQTYHHIWPHRPPSPSVGGPRRSLVIAPGDNLPTQSLLKTGREWHKTALWSTRSRGRVQMKESPMNALPRRIIVRVRMCAHHLMNW